jgi:cytochrome P450
MPEIWPEPMKFDPLRFTDEAVRARHKYAWVPFGGGAHMCLGLHFAYMQAKSFFYHLLTTTNVSLAPGYGQSWQMGRSRSRATDCRSGSRVSMGESASIGERCQGKAPNSIETSLAAGSRHLR